ncbi:hypothetical protein Ancab_012440 [Ancistrocladus abbreviatus]
MAGERGFTGRKGDNKGGKGKFINRFTNAAQDDDAAQDDYGHCGIVVNEIGNVIKIGSPFQAHEERFGRNTLCPLDQKQAKI